MFLFYLSTIGISNILATIRLAKAEINFYKKGYVKTYPEDMKLTFKEGVRQFIKNDWYLLLPIVNVISYALKFKQTDEQVFDSYTFLSNYNYDVPNRGNTIPIPKTAEYEKFGEEPEPNTYTDIGRIIYVKEYDQNIKGPVLVKRIAREADR